MYYPCISRFLSVDTLISMPYNSQRYNRYNYVINNPLKHTNPSVYDIFSDNDYKIITRKMMNMSQKNLILIIVKQGMIEMVIVNQ